MGNSGQRTDTPTGLASVKIAGVLDEAPRLKQVGRLGEDRGQFCEVPVRITDWSLPVRFENNLAVLVAGYLAGTQIKLRGKLRRYEWDGANGQPKERLVVLCGAIDHLRAPDNRIKAVTRDD